MIGDGVRRRAGPAGRATCGVCATCRRQPTVQRRSPRPTGGRTGAGGTRLERATGRDRTRVGGRSRPPSAPRTSRLAAEILNMSPSEASLGPPWGVVGVGACAAVAQAGGGWSDAAVTRIVALPLAESLVGRDRAATLAVMAKCVMVNEVLDGQVVLDLQCQDRILPRRQSPEPAIQRPGCELPGRTPAAPDPVSSDRRIGAGLGAPRQGRPENRRDGSLPARAGRDRSLEVLRAGSTRSTPANRRSRRRPR